MRKKEAMTPRELLAYLDRYIVGQHEAKKAIAVAMRNRYRRSLLSEEARREIAPKNIMMIGPTGVGKTEIARRMAQFIQAPFIKVEATKFTEVGYVGRDVESMIRDLVEVGVRMIREEKREEVAEEAKKAAETRLIELLVPAPKKQSTVQNPFEMLFGQQEKKESPTSEAEMRQLERKRAEIGAMLRIGKLEEEVVEVPVEASQSNILGMLPMGDQMIGSQMQDALSSLLPTKMEQKRMKVKDARHVLEGQEADRLLDDAEIARLAIERTEQEGIIFLDEIDKIATRNQQGGSQDVSREGVQRDILPIVEGSTVATKYGNVKTDFILFIAAGAFHMSKPSDIIPELQGRFPIRVELEKLTKEDFVRILTEPDFSLLRQYKYLLETEEIELTFSEEAIERLAEIAYEVNRDTENIGARRLHTILEKLLEDISFEAPDIAPARIEITPTIVDDKLQGIVKDEDLSSFIL